MNAIEIVKLTKYYGKICALNKMSLDVPEGTIYGLVGPNGAGKTTLIKALVGSLQPDSGYAKVLDLDPLKDKWKLRQQIGYMPQSPALYDDLSARNNILFFGKGQHVPDLQKKVDEILSFAELTKRANDAVRTFSGGMKKRVSLCCALIHNPKIIFLDEPTAAVDPHLKMQSWILFRKLAQKGVTIFVSTHQMDEAMLCDQVTILRNGEILAVDTPQNILKLGKTNVKIITNNEEKVSVIDSTPQSLADELKKYGLEKNISSVELHSDTIEDIILSIVQEKEKGNKS
ncbi:MAG TPA: ABC transporter ATP-binding protein [Prolixibacteraceae bacterium]|jgi:ABC-2 type transport system ATP-binding protein|nr:ABC transporter ATP-binding protein [Prolixibacteraceae bacterium]